MLHNFAMLILTLFSLWYMVCVHAYVTIHTWPTITVLDSWYEAQISIFHRRHYQKPSYHSLRRPPIYPGHRHSLGEGFCCLADLIPTEPRWHVHQSLSRRTGTQAVPRLCEDRSRSWHCEKNLVYNKTSEAFYLNLFSKFFEDTCNTIS